MTWKEYYVFVKIYTRRKGSQGHLNSCLTKRLSLIFARDKCSIRIRNQIKKTFASQKWLDRLWCYTFIRGNDISYVSVCLVVTQLICSGHVELLIHCEVESHNKRSRVDPKSFPLCGKWDCHMKKEYGYKSKHI